MTDTLTDTEPRLADAPPCWPPEVHIIHDRDRPVKEGTRALCGAKLMGIDMSGAPPNTPICERCLEIAAKELDLL